MPVIAAVESTSVQRRLVPALGVGLALGALTVFDGPVLCPFRRCTGGYCPLCGATRSLGSLARLDPVGALRLYPALPLLLIAAAVSAWPHRLGQRRSDQVLLVVAVAVVAIWLLRLATGAVPSPSELRWPVPLF